MLGRLAASGSSRVGDGQLMRLYGSYVSCERPAVRNIEAPSGWVAVTGKAHRRQKLVW
jgi:hypothetical protein